MLLEALGRQHLLLPVSPAGWSGSVRSLLLAPLYSVMAERTLMLVFLFEII